MLQTLYAALAAAICFSESVSASPTGKHMPRLPKRDTEHVYEKRASNTTGFRYLTNKTERELTIPPFFAAIPLMPSF